ncbi:MAG: Gfo/Idh/MocA family oxidoreductase [Clostridiales bacterium]|jgi:predicted dehydrogenase|nr:Gfo/Idh/MocA family oxidoreductase [Clostridiales bacterium]
MNIAILGAGARGANVYGNIFSRMSGVEISAVCDTDGTKANNAKRQFNVPENACFLDEDNFFAAGRLADGLVIATMDQDHYRQVMKALDAGYKKILLEKPVSNSRSEVNEIARRAKESGTDILVCHVLRYTAFYQTVKNVIRGGAIGDVTVINHQENVGYWHFAHSFTRGNWRNEETSAPILLAKTCHDFDLLYWFADSKCTEIKSFAALSHFRSENAPEGCAKRCLNSDAAYRKSLIGLGPVRITGGACKYIDVCPFGVKKLYIDKNAPFNWGDLHAVGKNHPTVSEKVDAFKNPQNPYGRCVYFCDNDVYDHQSVVMKFASGATASLTLTAFSKDCYRRIHITGSKGELFGNDNQGFLTLNVFGGKTKKIRVGGGLGGHLGGDNGICDTFVKLLSGEKIHSDFLTTIDVTAESHNMIFDAEETGRS